MQTSVSRRQSAFTLIELLVVVAIIALLISILVPSLNRAREQTKALVCLSNLRSLGQAVILYEGDNGRLPRSHQAIYRNTTRNNLIELGMSVAGAEHNVNRYLAVTLRPYMGVGSDGIDTAAEEVSTCPILTKYHTVDGFERYRAEKFSANAVLPLPTDYVTNNWGQEPGLEPEPGDGARPTNPQYYFGYSSNTPNDPVQDGLERKHPGKPISQIQRPSEEWAIADAWYRNADLGISPVDQGGPFQSSWTGEAFVPFAPHFAGRRWTFTTLAERRALAAQIQQAKNGDGRTQTLFFDGHAEPVQSRTFTVLNTALTYGFPGTVNQDASLIDNPNRRRVLEDGFWR